jgi:hypothetical protein
MQRLSDWFTALTLRGQLLSGCLVILTLSACLLYLLGAVSLYIRPYVFVTPEAVATVIVPPTQAPTPTPPPASTLALPGSTLVATPTQAPLPTRAPTSTPTIGEIPSITAEATPAVSETGTLAAPTNTQVATSPPPTIPPARLTNTPGPTRTRRPTRTPTGQP